MFKLILENENGDQLTFGMGTPYTIEEIDGLNPPDATINTSQISLIDGGKYNSAKVNMRQLQIAFAIEYSASYNRIQVYNVLKSKQWIRMYYTGDYRDVYIDGYISSIGVSHFAMKQVVTVSILCPSPYFQDAQQIVNEMKNIINLFHFPFYGVVSRNLMENTAETTTMNGVTFTVNSDGSVTVDGTATDRAYIVINASLDEFMNVGQSYILNGCPEGGSEAGYRLQMWYNNIGAAGYDIGEGVTVTPTDNIDVANVAIYINSGVTVSDLTFYPMIRSSNVTDDTYQQYGDNTNFAFGYYSNDVGLTVENEGDVECGMIIEIYARSAITNPKIFNYITQDFIGVNYSMIAGDLITIDTRKGQKTATLLRNGVTTNIFNYIMQNSTWLQLEAQGSTFVYEVTSGVLGDLLVTFKHTNLYEGV